MARQQRLRWAIVGVGVAGRARANAIEQDPRSVLVAVHRGRFAADVEAPTVGSVEEAVQAADCVAICSPAAAHPDQVRLAIAAQRHVLVEYPLVRDPALAESLFAEAKVHQRILHVEHIELLGAVPHTLRSLVHTDLIEDVDIRFEGPGSADLRPYDVAWANVARIHRVVDVAGPVDRVDTVESEPGGLRATLTLRSGALLTAQFRYSPVGSRRTRMRVATPGTVWEQINDSLMRNGTPQTLLGTGSLFKIDQLAATARILDATAPYVSDDRVLHVLRVVERLASESPGPI